MRKQGTKVVGLLGSGVIGRVVAEQLARGAVEGCVLGPVVTRTSGHPDELVECDVVVECAGVDAAVLLVPALLHAGTDVVLCSCAAVVDPQLGHDLATARRTGARLLLPTGAVGGLDLFRAAVRGGADPRVELHTTKSAGAVGGTTGELEVVFTGSAREAARTFPRTANVAVVLALSTTGLDATTVQVTADPAATKTRHVLRCSSSLGEAVLDVTNTVAAGSDGRTSAITAWSVVTLLEDLARGGGPGVAVPWGRPASAWGRSATEAVDVTQS